MSRRQSIPLEGEFNCWTRDFDLPDLLFAVCERNETGFLRFVSAEAEKTLFLREGQIIFATSSSVDDRLGEYLLRTGKVRLKDLARVGGQVKPGKRLGALLVENNLLNAKELVRAVVEQVRSIIVSLFRWTEAWYGFNVQELPSRETITLNMSTAELILDGIRQIDSWRRILKGVGELTTVYRTAAGHEAAVRTMDLDAQALEILAVLSRPRSVEAVCSGSRLRDFETCRLLWTYRSLGLIEAVEEVDFALAAEATTDTPTPAELPAPPPLEASQTAAGVGEPFSLEVAVAPMTAEPMTAETMIIAPVTAEPLAFSFSPTSDEPPFPQASEAPPADPVPVAPEPMRETPSFGTADSDLEGLGLVLGGSDAEPVPAGQGTGSPRAAEGNPATQAPSDAQTSE